MRTSEVMPGETYGDYLIWDMVGAAGKLCDNCLFPVLIVLMLQTCTEGPPRSTTNFIISACYVCLTGL